MLCRGSDHTRVQSVFQKTWDPQACTSKHAQGDEITRPCSVKQHNDSHICSPLCCHTSCFRLHNDITSGKMILDSGATCCVTAPHEPLHVTVKFRVSNAPSPIIFGGFTRTVLYRRSVQHEATEDICGFLVHTSRWMSVRQQSRLRCRMSLELVHDC